MSAEEERPLAALSAHEQSLAIERLKGDLRVLNAAIEAMEDARSLQAIEYERRLAGLNHEAEQLKAMQAKYVSIEVYGRDLKENDLRLRKVESFMGAHQGTEGGREATTKLFTQTIPTLVLALIAIGSTVIAIAFAIQK